ncbi:probable inactive 2-oxoglutarate-dependent dioxygenase AOP2 [Cryptomeria japonica]|uniref:probable inactive 2-oxoglutarate-dependent dioxygenase AOP2 n=1 Tax=Cryptomeria japonica TaxID=3369 RepID=UPI0025AD872E|nr:probable inactive 2-oxoglutarate-dependent dioxygenase AOP2 [Cryptomeria japonica]
MSPAMGSYECEAKLDDIPILDLSHSGEDKCLEALREACEELGCFRIVNHGISADLLLKAEQACREVFKLPTETKKKNVSPNPYAGYYGGMPFYESLGIALSSTRDPQAIQDFTHLMWPQGNQNFSETMEEYTCEMMELLNKVHQAILESFGVSKYYATHFDHRKGIFRMNLYDLTSELCTESTRQPAHTDANSISILYEDACGGFQVWSREGNWIDVKPIPNSFVVLAGDSFQAWSNGKIRSVKHQVMVKRQQSRLCLATYNLFPDEMEIKAPMEFVDDKHRPHYKAFKFVDMLKYRLGEGREIQEPLQQFAGVYV